MYVKYFIQCPVFVINFNNYNYLKTIPTEYVN